MSRLLQCKTATHLVFIQEEHLVLINRKRLVATNLALPVEKLIYTNATAATKRIEIVFLVLATSTVVVSNERILTEMLKRFCYENCIAKVPSI